MFKARIAIFFFLLFTGSVVQAQLVYHWDFTSGSTIDSINGVAATLANPVGLSAAGYSFTNEGDGITINQPGGLAVSSTYTIEMDFSLEIFEDEYQRLIDFNDFSTDAGMYVYDDYFYFYDESPDDDTYTISTDERVTFRISRDGSTNLVTATLNGTELWSFTDSSGYAEFSGTNNIMHFFEDESDEHPTGTVSEIRVFASATAPPGRTGTTSVPTLPLGGLAILAALIGWLGMRSASRDFFKIH